MTQIKGYVLDPLAHALAQMVLKQITASVVNAINGQGTGGHSMFVQNLGASLQNIGDKAALNFIAEITTRSNSPFAGTIASSLRTNYLQSSSAAGFWAANTCTLSKVSSNINSFVAGNFSQGGWAAWFSLTTQPNNNPYDLYFRAQSELAGRSTALKAQHTAQLNWGQGFTSWCGGGGGTSGVGNACTNSADGTTNDCPGELVCLPDVPGGKGKCAVPTGAQSDAVGGENCVNKDGSTGTIQTPGSVIMDQLDKTLGSGVDSLVSVHDFNQMVDTILSALVNKVISTGLSALSGGGSGSGGGGSGGGSFTSQLGSGSNSSNPNAASVASQATSLAQHTIAQLATYTSAWQTIENAANAASTSAQSVIACETSHGIPDSYGAQTALTSEIPPVVASAQQAFTTASTTNALALRVEADAANYTSSTAGAGGALAADTQALTAAPPTATDIADAQSQSSTGGTATASSSTSLIVSGGSLLDQMKLIQDHAANAVSACENPLLQII